MDELAKDGNRQIIIELHVAPRQPGRTCDPCNTFESGSINVPPALSTPAAQELLQKAQAAGWLDERLQYVGTKARAAILADEMAVKLGLEPRWKPFEELWSTTNLRQTCYSAGDTSRGWETRKEVQNLLK